jgi:hypothetical protein
MPKISYTRLPRPTLPSVLALCVTLTGCGNEAQPPRTPSAPTVELARPSRAQELLAHLSAGDHQMQESARVVAAGDEVTRRAASSVLVARARTVTSPSWREAARPKLERANAAAKLAPTLKQLEWQIDQFRNEELLRVIMAMDVVAGREVVAYCFELAEDDAAPILLRRGALVVLNHHVDVSDVAALARRATVSERVSARIAAEAATSAAAQPSTGTVSNAASIVAGMASDFRRCYNKGLAANPDMTGSARLTVKIGPKGEVLSVAPTSAGLSEWVVSCLVTRVASAQFTPPEGGGATVVIPVTFVTKDE